MKILLIAEHDNKQLKSVNYHTYSAALELKAEVDVVIIGFGCDEVMQEAQRLPGVANILIANAKEYTHQLPENMAQLIADMAKDYDYVVTGATSFGKNLLPRVAALKDVPMLSDVVKIISENTFVRPIYAVNS